MRSVLKTTLNLALILIIMGWALIGIGSAGTLIVPTNYQTIQAAVNAASPGDTIQVLPGQYRESITLLDRGKAGITLQGTDRSTTIINPAGTGRGISILVADNVKIKHLTITGGVASDFGGGIFIDGSNGVEVSDTLLIRNRAVNGGGLASRNSTLSLLDNQIQENMAVNNADARGGGAFFYSTHGQVSGNQFLNNSTQGPTMAPGGGLFLQLSDPIVSNNIFSGNQTSGAQHYGGGLYIYESQNFQVSQNTFLNNKGLDGGGMAVIESNAAIVNNQFQGNQARWGAGVYGWHMSSSIENNTFTQNRAADPNAGGGEYSLIPHPRLSSGIIPLPAIPPTIGGEG